FGRKAASQASAIDDHMMLGNFLNKFIINIAHIHDHFPFTSFSRAFSKSAIIYQNHIIIIPVKIFRILTPAFDTSGITMKIKDHSFRILTEKMKSVNGNTFSWGKK